MTAWPARGAKPWDDALRAYIDDADSGPALVSRLAEVEASSVYVPIPPDLYTFVAGDVTAADSWFGAGAVAVEIMTFTPTVEGTFDLHAPGRVSGISNGVEVYAFATSDDPFTSSLADGFNLYSDDYTNFTSVDRVTVMVGADPQARPEFELNTPIKIIVVNWDTDVGGVIDLGPLKASLGQWSADLGVYSRPLYFVPPPPGAIGPYSHAEGSGTARGHTSHAEGSGTVAISSPNAHAEGVGTTASAQAAHAEGQTTTASATAAHAEGWVTSASGFAAHTEGGSTSAIAPYAHAEGQDTQASNTASHAEGVGTQAPGAHSHAEGKESLARWTGSHALADGYFAEVGDAQHQTKTLKRAGDGKLTVSAGNNAYPANVFAAFRALIVAHGSTKTKAKSWEITGMLETNASGVHALIGTPTKTVIADKGTSGYDIATSVDANGLAFTVSGTPTRTVATVWFTEVGA